MLESLFGFVAKGTMALAALIAMVLAILSGEGLELVSLPTTKKDGCACCSCWRQ
ncbi:hypothetical protein [Burkholderia ubonensis]|uniref:hypothetical protein n=1 Tax=Burkholderia ubonensis TaxID=101571 RepID=UPI000A836025|nr:hypothetical protein [Burkholderia ubonensis]